MAAWCGRLGKSSEDWPFSGFVAGGAVLGFVVVHGDEEHLIAADAHTVDLNLRFSAGLRRRVIGMLQLGLTRLMRFGHT